MGERMERDWRDGLTFILCYGGNIGGSTLGGSRNTPLSCVFVSYPSFARSEELYKKDKALAKSKLR